MKKFITAICMVLALSMGLSACSTQGVEDSARPTQNSKSGVPSFVEQSSTATSLQDTSSETTYVYSQDDSLESVSSEQASEISSEQSTQVNSEQSSEEQSAQSSQTSTSDSSSQEEQTAVLPAGLTLYCTSGNDNCYTVNGNTITFNTITAKTVYVIKGTLNGNIIVDVGDDYNFELEMQGLTLSCSYAEPISVLSGNKFTLSAKNGYTNSISDTRAEVSDTDTTQSKYAVNSCVDMQIGGKGTLNVTSLANNGIHTKKDLTVQNLVLNVTCKDNALKGNDSVTITSGTITLIASQGDGIKTEDSDVSSKGNQRGNVTVSGGNLYIYSACDGIDAAYNVNVSGTGIVQIYTDSYSQYSEEVTAVSSSTYYIRNTTSSYKYSIKYFNSSSDYVWANSTYYTSMQGGMGRTYYYYTIDKPSGYSYMKVYVYSSSQTQGQESSYYACSDQVTVNDSYDTLSLSTSNSRVTVSWTNYTTQQQGPGGPGGGGFPGGMEEGNTDKREYSNKGLKAANEIIISGGDIYIKSYDDALHTNNDVLLGDEDDASDDHYGTGNIYISGGTLNVYSNDDGIHADGGLYISGGTVKVENSYEGIEGNYIEISDGFVSVSAKDDGVNATPSSGIGLAIKGGTLYVHSGGDGLDSNSRTSNQGIVFSGGKTVVISTSGGNSCIDTEQGYTHSSGYVLAICPTNAMTSEVTNGSYTARTTVSSISLTGGNYLSVSANGSLLAAVKMPLTMTAFVILLGANSASMTSASSISQTLDANGVYWA